MEKFIRIFIFSLKAAIAVVVDVPLYKVDDDKKGKK